MNKKRLKAEKIQRICNENNKHLENPKLYHMAGKEERKKLKARENTLPLEMWIE